MLWYIPLITAGLSPSVYSSFLLMLPSLHPLSVFHPFACPFLYLFNTLYVYAYVCSFIHLSISVCSSVQLFICMSIQFSDFNLPVCPSVQPSLSLYLFCLSIHPNSPSNPYTCPSRRLSISLSVHLSTCQSLSFICPTLRVFIPSSVHLSRTIYNYVCSFLLSVHLSILSLHFSIYPSVCSSLYLFIPPSNHPYISPSVRMHAHLFQRLSIHSSVLLSLQLCTFKPEDQCRPWQPNSRVRP